MMHFIDERYIFDYVDNEQTLYRVNRVLSRIGLDPIDNRIVPWMESARQRVYAKIDGLLEKYALKLTSNPEA